jgi:hypothetical protein
MIEERRDGEGESSSPFLRSTKGLISPTVQFLQCARLKSVCKAIKYSSAKDKLMCEGRKGINVKLRL